MLTLSPAAADAVTTLMKPHSDVETAGLRIGGASPEYTLDVVKEPAADDVVVEQNGARVYLSTDAARSLEDRKLDARRDDSGAFSFALALQD